MVRCESHGNITGSKTACIRPLCLRKWMFAGQGRPGRVAESLVGIQKTLEDIALPLNSVLDKIATLASSCSGH